MTVDCVELKTTLVSGINGFDIGITNSSQSKIASVAEFPLITGVPMNLMGSYSCQARISQLVILELILSEIAKLFSEKTY